MPRDLRCILRALKTAADDMADSPKAEIVSPNVTLVVRFFNLVFLSCGSLPPFGHCGSWSIWPPTQQGETHETQLARRLGYCFQHDRRPVRLLYCAH